MAYIITNSEFKPLTLEEKLAPYLMYKEEYDKVLDSYEEALNNANVMEILQYSDVDQDAYDMYKRKEDFLQAAMNNFVENGLNMTTRKDLWNAKTSMNDLLIPMQAAYNRKLELIKNAESNKDRSLEYFLNPENVKVTTLMKNMGWTPQSFSKNELMNQGALISSGSRDLLLHDSDPYRTTTDNKLLERNILKGFSQEDSMIIEGILRGKNGAELGASDIHYRAAEALYDIVQNSGVYSWEDGDRKNEAIDIAINSVMTGFNSKLGQEALNSIANPTYSSNSGSGARNPNYPTESSSARLGIPAINPNSDVGKEIQKAKNLVEIMSDSSSGNSKYFIENGQIKIKTTEQVLEGHTTFTKEPIYSSSTTVKNFDPQNTYIAQVLRDNPNIKTIEQLQEAINALDVEIASFHAPIELNATFEGNLSAASRVLSSVDETNINQIQVLKGDKEVKDRVKINVINALKNNDTNVVNVGKVSIDPLTGNFIIGVNYDEQHYNIVLTTEQLPILLNGVVSNQVLNGITTNAQILNDISTGQITFKSKEKKKQQITELQQVMLNYADTLFNSLFDPWYGKAQDKRVNPYYNN